LRRRQDRSTKEKAWGRRTYCVSSGCGVVYASGWAEAQERTKSALAHSGSGRCFANLAETVCL
jgi:hypothetical protein